MDNLCRHAKILTYFSLLKGKTVKPIVILLGCVTLAACTTEEGKPSPSLNMANPAAVYCLHVGGKLSTSESDAGKKGIVR